MARRLTASGRIHGFDSEPWPWDPEEKDHNFTLDTILDNPLPQNVLKTEIRWGGELRVELDLAAQILDNEDIRVLGDARLYEGTTQNTTELDGTLNFMVFVPRDTTAPTSQRVKNDDEGGDYADILINFSNTSA